jgi:hypothetical protein
MSNEYKLMFLENGKIYISEIVEKNENELTLKNPMIVDYKYNTENNPTFRYVPWQIVAKDEEVIIDRNKITMMTNPKTEMLDVYQRICIAFIPLEVDEDE